MKTISQQQQEIVLNVLSLRSGKTGMTLQDIVEETGFKYAITQRAVMALRRQQKLIGSFKNRILHITLKQ